MEQLDTVILLMACLAALYTVAEKFAIPYPIVLVVAGLGIGFIPGIPLVTLSPELVFLIFLPPLLFDAARNTSWHDFKAHAAPIGRLALGLVLFSTVGIAVGTYYLIPGFTWPLAFLLGAIISPPDVVAATSAIKGLRLPRPLITILEGESLINDASALIVYRFALLACTGAIFSFTAFSIQFLIVAIGGLSTGYLLGHIFLILQKRFFVSSTVETSVTLLLPFLSYLLAEHLNASGVLAVVTSGLMISRRAHEIFAYSTRMRMTHFWEVLTFMLNGFVFILIGMQLHQIITGIENELLFDLIFYSSATAVLTIALRLLWVYLSVFIVSCLNSLAKRPTPSRSLKELFVIGWSGMRGMVSLAAALAIPLTLGNGETFPHRDTILFITFVVIFVTLVLQGLSLPWFVRWLGVQEQENDSIVEERLLRLKLAENALNFIHVSYSENRDDPAVLEIHKRFERQVNYLNGILEGEKGQISVEDNGMSKYEFYERYMTYEHEIIEHQRKQIIQLSKNTNFSYQSLLRIEAELDAWNLNMAAKFKALRKS